MMRHATFQWHDTTTLMCAVRRATVTVLKELLAAGADTDARDYVCVDFYDVHILGGASKSFNGRTVVFVIICTCGCPCNSMSARP